MPADLQKARELFLHAVGKLTPEQWEGYIAEACGGNAELAQQVRRLLQVHQEAGSFLDRPAAAIGVTGAFAPEPGAEAPAVPLQQGAGMVIGPYKLLQQIGEGGMGSVWMAEQTQPVQRKVALKLIKVGMDSNQVIARFEAERQALALMDHPNIARVLDAGATSGEPGGISAGSPYFVMELVKGVSITAYCDENRLTPRQRLELFIPVCQAIQHAHQKGIIHRDIKPSNVLVALYDGTPVPKVIDFGIAKATDQQLTEKTLFTRHGQIVGTFEYMSPEQATLDAHDVDTRSDIYSLGVLLYELLTGTTPLDKDRLRQAAFLEVLRLIREEDVPRPSSRLSESRGALVAASVHRHTDADKLLALVMGELDWIVMKSLDKDRTRRYATAGGLALDVEHYLKDEQVEACPPTAGYRLRKFVRRNKAPVLTAALVLVAVLAGIASTTWGWIEALAQRDDAVQARAEEAEQRRLALANAAEAKANELRAKDNEMKAAANAAQATKQEKLAKEQAKIAQDNETKAEWRLYASNIASAQREWETGSVSLLHHYLKQCRPDFRGWEHDYLYTLATQNQHTLEVGARLFDSFAISLDGKLLARAYEDGKGGKDSLARAYDNVTLWDVASGREVLTFKAHPFIFSVAFSPDGKLLATAAAAQVLDDGQESVGHVIKLWDVASGKEILTFQGLVSYARTKLKGFSLAEGSVVFDPDGKQLACTGVIADTVCWVELFDVASGQGVVLERPKKGFSCPVFSPDGKRLACPNFGTVKVWDLATKKVVLTFSGDAAVAFSPDGKHLAIGSPAGLKLCDATSGQEVLTLQSTEGYPAAFSADGKRLAGTSGESLKVWDTTTGKEILTLKGHMHGFGSVAFSPDGKLLISEAHGTVKVWDAATAQGPLTFKAHTREVLGLTFSPDGKRLASCGNVPYSTEKKSASGPKVGGELKLWDTATGQEVPFLKGPLGFVNCVAFSPDGKLLAAAMHDKTVKMWDAASGQEIRTLKGHKSPVRSVAFSPDSKILASASDDRTMNVKLWDAATGLEILTLKGHENGVRSLAFSPDGKRLASREWFGTVKVWDMANGQPILTLQDGQGYVGFVAFSPDSKCLALRSSEGFKLWDATSGQEVRTFEGHGGHVTHVSFSPDGKRLASASSDLGIGSMKLWDTATGQNVLTIRVPAGHVANVTFSPDGQRLASSDWGGTIMIWDASKSMKEAGQK